MQGIKAYLIYIDHSISLKDHLLNNGLLCFIFIYERFKIQMLIIGKYGSII